MLLSSIIEIKKYNYLFNTEQLIVLNNLIEYYNQFNDMNTILKEKINIDYNFYFKNNKLIISFEKDNNIFYYKIFSKKLKLIKNKIDDTFLIEIINNVKIKILELNSIFKKFFPLYLSLIPYVENQAKIINQFFKNHSSDDYDVNELLEEALSLKQFEKIDEIPGFISVLLFNNHNLYLESVYLDYSFKELYKLVNKYDCPFFVLTCEQSFIESVPLFSLIVFEDSFERVTFSNFDILYSVFNGCDYYCIINIKNTIKNIMDYNKISLLINDLNSNKKMIDKSFLNQLSFDLNDVLFFEDITFELWFFFFSLDPIFTEKLLLNIRSKDKKLDLHNHIEKIVTLLKTRSNLEYF